MGTPLRPLPVKLIVGMIAREPACFETALSRLCRRFGPVDLSSAVVPFDQTDYYEKELGRDLKRRFLSFSRLLPATELCAIKLLANSLEREISPRGRARAINIDPGYVTLSKLVLATTKNFSHRLYIKNGIFEEVTLCFRQNSFQPLAWTYPDYRTAAAVDFFNSVRSRCAQQLEEKYGNAQLHRCV